MTNKKIHILTAPKQSGKTTSLVQWSAHRSNVYGILTPIINGSRMFMNAHTKEQFRMEAKEGEKHILEVGKYSFSKMFFKKASTILLNALNQNEGYIIVDEIGPLELRGLGFTDCIKEMLNNNNNTLQYVFVIRDSLVDDVIAYFRLRRFVIINMEL